LKADTGGPWDLHLEWYLSQDQPGISQELFVWPHFFGHISNGFAVLVTTKLSKSFAMLVTTKISESFALLITTKLSEGFALLVTTKLARVFTTELAKVLPCWLLPS
jgi:hypothetical protein